MCFGMNNYTYVGLMRVDHLLGTLASMQFLNEQQTAELALVLGTNSIPPDNLMKRFDKQPNQHANNQCTLQGVVAALNSTSTKKQQKHHAAFYKTLDCQCPYACMIQLVKRSKK